MSKDQFWPTEEIILSTYMEDSYIIGKSDDFKGIHLNRELSLDAGVFRFFLSKFMYYSKNFAYSSSYTSYKWLLEWRVPKLPWRTEWITISKLFIHFLRTFWVYLKKIIFTEFFKFICVCWQSSIIFVGFLN